MKINWQKHLHIVNKIFLFFLGIVFVHFLASIVATFFLPEILQVLTEEVIRSYFAHLDKEILYSLIRIYIISFVLFVFLPKKITHSPRYLRGLYFILFYMFCIFVYLWV